VDGDMHGPGTLRFPNGDVFDGAFRRNAMHGAGVFTYANGDVYEGQYVDGVRVGGALVKADGTRFDAEFTPEGKVTQLTDKATGTKISFSAGASIEEAADEADAEGKAAKAKAAAADSWKSGEGSVTYGNGDAYRGAFDDSKRHGFGTMVYANGDVYEGEWANDKRSGDGKMTWNEVTQFSEWSRGWRYVGRWSMGEFHGHGTLWYDVDGGKYVGQWENGIKCGLGREELAGDVYEGDFAGDRRHGKGTLTTRDGIVFTGKFVDGACRDDEATVTFGEKQQYDGAVVNRHRHGEGRMLYPNGDVYDGEFFEDKRKGVGLLRFANGDSYEGQFDEDAMHGNGTLSFADGVVYEGRMRANLKDGPGTLTYTGSMAAFKVLYRENVLVSKEPL